MSINFSRSGTKHITNNREYKLIRYNWKDNRYCEKIAILKTGKWPSERRMYKTWKYNRKTQYKTK